MLETNFELIAKLRKRVNQQQEQIDDLVMAVVKINRRFENLTEGD